MKRFAFLALFAVACASARPSDEAAVRATMMGFMDALNALDVPKMAAFFADDITAFVPAAQPQRAEGRAAVTHIFERFAERVRPTTPRLDLKPEKMEVFVSGDIGVVTFEVHDAPDMTRRRTVVFERRGGRWLMRHIHASDFASPPR